MKHYKILIIIIFSISGIFISVSADSNLTNDLNLPDLISFLKQENITDYLYRLESFGQRFPGTDSSQAARNWIVDQMQSFGHDSVYLDPYSNNVFGQLTECNNIVVTKPGNLYPNIQIIVGAHYDGYRNSPAVNENGSGVATVMEIARVLASYKTDVTIRYVFFDCGSYDRSGSSHYVENANNRGDQILLMLNHDMIGGLLSVDTVEISIANLENDYTDKWIEFAKQFFNISITTPPSYAPNTDHLSFYSVDYPAFNIREQYYSSHTGAIHDSARYINYDYVSNIAKTSLAAIYYFSNNDDIDLDSIPNIIDNCPFNYNPLQDDFDFDGHGDTCDNCLETYNPYQEDEYKDGIGDLCDGQVHIQDYVLPPAYLGVPYEYQISAIGASAPYNWRKLGGDMPYGVEFTGGTTAILSGTPSWKATYFFTVEVNSSDVPNLSDTVSYAMKVSDPPDSYYFCGDADRNWVIELPDAVYLVNYIFATGNAPVNLMAGDSDCSGSIDISDTVYLLNYIFNDGPEPCLSCN